MNKNFDEYTKKELIEEVENNFECHKYVFSKIKEKIPIKSDSNFIENHDDPKLDMYFSLLQLFLIEDENFAKETIKYIVYLAPCECLLAELLYSEYFVHRYSLITIFGKLKQELKGKKIEMQCIKLNKSEKCRGFYNFFAEERGAVFRREVYKQLITDKVFKVAKYTLQNLEIDVFENDLVQKFRKRKIFPYFFYVLLSSRKSAQTLNILKEFSALNFWKIKFLLAKEVSKIISWDKNVGLFILNNLLVEAGLLQTEEMFLVEKIESTNKIEFSDEYLKNGFTIYDRTELSYKISEGFSSSNETSLFLFFLTKFFFKLTEELKIEFLNSLDNCCRNEILIKNGSNDVIKGENKIEEVIKNQNRGKISLGKYLCEEDLFNFFYSIMNNTSDHVRFTAVKILQYLEFNPGRENLLENCINKCIKLRNISQVASENENYYERNFEKKIGILKHNFQSKQAESLRVKHTKSSEWRNRILLLRRMAELSERNIDLFSSYLKTSFFEFLRDRVYLIREEACNSLINLIKVHRSEMIVHIYDPIKEIMETGTVREVQSICKLLVFISDFLLKEKEEELFIKTLKLLDYLAKSDVNLIKLSLKSNLEEIGNKILFERILLISNQN